MREGVPLPSNNDQLLFVTKAAYFAAQAHREQRRKDEQKTPYINHLTEVAHLLAAAGCEQVVVAAGYLHDTIEDVGVTYEMLHAEFGKAVADLVLAVTDDKTLEKQVRKQLQVEHALHASPEIAALKMADKISNLRSLNSAPPSGWSQQRLVDYVEWAHRVVSNLPHRNLWLLEQYDEIRKELLAACAAPVSE
jgi:(p)ppGpp synthase/HD superfamily hydrolase